MGCETLSLLLYLTIIFKISSGICITFNSTTISSACGAFIPEGQPVFIVPSVTLEFLTATIEETFRSIEYYGNPEPCAIWVKAVVCWTAFRPCLVINNVPVPYPIQPCKSICTNFVDNCNTTIARTGIPLSAPVCYPNDMWNANCSDMPDPDAFDTPFFPESETNYSLPLYNFEGSVPCFKSQRNIGNMTNSECWSPLIVGADSSCMFACPLPALSDNELKSMKLMQGIISWISLVLAGTLFLTYLTNPSLRAYPKVMVLMISLAALILATGMTLPTYVGHNQVWCGGQNVTIPTPLPTLVWQNTTFGQVGGSNVQYSLSQLTIRSALCSLQGAFILFGILSATYWWALIAFSMWLEVSWKDFWQYGRRKQLGHKLFLLIGWGIPLVCTAIPTAMNQIGFQPDSSMWRRLSFFFCCFLAVGEDILWNTAEFFVPMGFALFSGLVFFLLTLGKICYLRLRKWILLAVVSLRVFCFIVTFFLIFTLFVLYSLHYFLNRDSIEQRYADYFGCLTGTSFTFPSKCTLAGPATNFPLLILRGLALSSVGTLLFLNFISWEMFRHWHTVFYELLGGRWY